MTASISSIGNHRHAVRAGRAAWATHRGLGEPRLRDIRALQTMLTGPRATRTGRCFQSVTAYLELHEGTAQIPTAKRSKGWAQLLASHPGCGSSQCHLSRCARSPCPPGMGTSWAGLSPGSPALPALPTPSSCAQGKRLLQGTNCKQTANKLPSPAF